MELVNANETLQRPVTSPSKWRTSTQFASLSGIRSPLWNRNLDFPLSFDFPLPSGAWMRDVSIGARNTISPRIAAKLREDFMGNRELVSNSLALSRKLGMQQGVLSQMKTRSQRLHLFIIRAENSRSACTKSIGPLYKLSFDKPTSKISSGCAMIAKFKLANEVQ